MAQLESGVFQTVAEQALEEWDLAVEKVELASVSENIVFRVDTYTGQTYALRIHRPGYHTLAELNSEQQWTTALNEAGIGVPVPKRTRTGNGYVTLPLPDTQEMRHVGLVEWIDGVTLASILEKENDEKSLTRHFNQLGRFTARMHNQAADWRVPSGFKRHALDAEGLMGDEPFWGPFWKLPELTAAESDRIRDARRSLHKILMDYGKSPKTFSLIHADLHPYNVLVNGKSISVIDFDDAGFGWHLYDLAVALFYDQEKPHFETTRDALISGYRTERQLDDTVDQLLPIFLLIRGLAILGWLQDRPEHNNEARQRSLIERVCTQAETLLG